MTLVVVLKITIFVMENIHRKTLKLRKYLLYGMLEVVKNRFVRRFSSAFYGIAFDSCIFLENLLFLSFLSFLFIQDINDTVLHKWPKIKSDQHRGKWDFTGSILQNQTMGRQLCIKDNFNEEPRCPQDSDLALYIGHHLYRHSEVIEEGEKERQYRRYSVRDKMNCPLPFHTFEVSPFPTPVITGIFLKTRVNKMQTNTQWQLIRNEFIMGLFPLSFSC